MTVTLNSPKFEELDLSAFDAEYAGQAVRVVINPSRAFRAEYRTACAAAVLGTNDADFLQCLAAVLDKPVDEVADYVNNLPPDAAQWLFFFTIDNYNEAAGKFETSIPPHLFRLWDEWILRRVKAHAAQGVNSESKETTHSAAE
jgi:hypothetical protein